MTNTLKTVVVTGGTKGIGAVIAEAFYHAGFAVVICGRQDTGLAKRLGRGVFFVKADLTRLKEAQRLMAQAVKLTGRIDILINCAGVSSWKPLKSIDDRFLSNMLDTNLKSVFWSTQSALNYLKAGSSIINLSSLAGKRGSSNNSAYCAAKFGVVGVTQALAKELGPQGIRVNAVCPVYVTTDSVLEALKDKNSPALGKPVSTYLKEFTLSQAALKRLPTAQEVAQVCLFLSSDQASAITGQNINVDCGVLPQ
jgi:NAD(P)-dependent dehydrogenase (short-subunit alcohol dehydrogenase family)